jgi:predicted aspartyl protease
LKNEVDVNSQDREILKVPALWDTGATNTCISNQIVEELALVPTGKKSVRTASGSKEVSTYLINIKLPNNVDINAIEVCDSDIGNQGIALLIGMDIIGVGDFSVSNYQGHTVFSFRIPSQGKIDYVKETRMSNLIGKKHGSGTRKRKHR